MRCSAKRVTEHKVTFSPVNGSASGTYTSSVGYADTFPSEGKAERTAFAPNAETFSAVHNIFVAAATGHTRSSGVLRGRSRIEPRLLISSLSAGANRGSLRGGTP